MYEILITLIIIILFQFVLFLISAKRNKNFKWSLFNYFFLIFTPDYLGASLGKSKIKREFEGKESLNFKKKLKKNMEGKKRIRKEIMEEIICR